MSALEASIESLTAEYTTLTQKLEQIDQQYRVERPVVVSPRLPSLHARSRRVAALLVQGRVLPTSAPPSERSQS
jgi:hypothetical protein